MNDNTKVFQVGDYWLSQRDDIKSNNWYRTWYCPKRRKTRRASLGTECLDSAKELLNEWYIIFIQKSAHNNDLALSTVFLKYWNLYAKDIASSDVIKYSLKLWTEFFPGFTAKEINMTEINKFVKHLKEKGLSNGSINRYICDGRSAINFCYDNDFIDKPPRIKLLPKGESFKFRPTAKQLGSFFNHIKIKHTERLFRYMIIRLCTACRNDAALDLTIDQIDFDYNLVNLNPAGREQTKKYRPTIPLSPTLKYWIKKWNPEKYLIESPRKNSNGESVKLTSIRQAWRQTKIRAKLPDQFIAKCLRHSVATEMRRQQVNQWEVSGILGHSTGTVTDDYAIFDPTYLSNAIKAIESNLVMIQRHTNLMIIPQNQKSHLVAVSN